MADDTKNATLRSNLKLGTGAAKASVTGANVLDATVEVAALASAGSTYTMVTLPSNARIHGLSKFAWDILDTTVNDPKLDIGVAGVAGNIAADPDALNDGLDITAASAGSGVIKDIANWGKELWVLAGKDADPGGNISITCTITDHGIDDGGTISACIVYSVD